MNKIACFFGILIASSALANDYEIANEILSQNWFIEDIEQALDGGSIIVTLKSQTSNSVLFFPHQRKDNQDLPQSMYLHFDDNKKKFEVKSSSIPESLILNRLNSIYRISKKTERNDVQYLINLITTRDRVVKREYANTNLISMNEGSFLTIATFHLKSKNINAASKWIYERLEADNVLVMNIYEDNDMPITINEVKHRIIMPFSINKKDQATVFLTYRSDYNWLVFLLFSKESTQDGYLGEVFAELVSYLKQVQTDFLNQDFE